MEDVLLNKVMISHINNVVGLSMRALCIKIGIPINTFTHWTEQGTIRVRDLVTVCNHFRIPFRAFLTYHGEEDRMKTVSSLAKSESDFHPVVFRYELIRTCGRCFKPVLPVTDIAERMGISFNKFKKFYSREDANNFTVDDFLCLCRVTNLPMEYFLDDPSWDGQESPEKSGLVSKSPEKTGLVPERPKKTDLDQERPKKPNEVKELLEENKKLREQLSKLIDRVEQLESKLDNVATKQDITRSVHRYRDPGTEYQQTGEGNNNMSTKN